MVSVARDCLAMYRKNEDIINLGAYSQGANPRIDKAIKVNEQVMNVLRQKFTEKISRTDAYNQLAKALR